MAYLPSITKWFERLHKTKRKMNFFLCFVHRSMDFCFNDKNLSVQILLASWVNKIWRVKDRRRKIIFCKQFKAYLRSKLRTAKIEDTTKLFCKRFSTLFKLRIRSTIRIVRKIADENYFLFFQAILDLILSLNKVENQTNQKPNLMQDKLQLKNVLKQSF